MTSERFNSFIEDLDVAPSSSSVVPLCRLDETVDLKRMLDNIEKVRQGLQHIFLPRTAAEVRYVKVLLNTRTGEAPVYVLYFLFFFDQHQTQ